MTAEASDTPDDILGMALDIQESIDEFAFGGNDPGINGAPTACGMMDNRLATSSVSSVVNVNETVEQTANFNLEVPGLDWQAMLQTTQPVMNISNCAVTINFGSSK